MQGDALIAVANSFGDTLLTPVVKARSAFDLFPTPDVILIWLAYTNSDGILLIHGGIQGLEYIYTVGFNLIIGYIFRFMSFRE